MRVLIVEDDRRLADFLVRAFTEEGYSADLCKTGAEAQAQVRATTYDVVILDWMLPEGDGISVCRTLRMAGCMVPVLMLTARGETSEKVLALDAGADDYLTKPFSLDELMARVRALLRRVGQHSLLPLRVGSVVLDIRNRCATVEGARVDLTGREFALLVLFLEHTGQVVTRSEILDRVFGLKHDPGTNIIEVHVRHLREKLGPAARYLETVRGQGYRFQADEAATR